MEISPHKVYFAARMDEVKEVNTLQGQFSAVGSVHFWFQVGKQDVIDYGKSVLHCSFLHSNSQYAHTSLFNVAQMLLLESYYTRNNLPATTISYCIIALRWLISQN
jgi:hypothetical protein